MSGASVKSDKLVASKIASLTIGGQALGTFAGGDAFGVVAQLVGAVRVGGTSLVLAQGPENDNFFVGITGDFKVNEI